jgi:hypothetical protein
MAVLTAHPFLSRPLSIFRDAWTVQITLPDDVADGRRHDQRQSRSVAVHRESLSQRGLLVFVVVLVLGRSLPRNGMEIWIGLKGLKIGVSFGLGVQVRL